MRLNELEKGNGRARKRVGRGAGSLLGKTSGRGHKGQRARSGGFHKQGFEGGQMPLQRRLPKRGFSAFAHKTYAVINLGDLALLSKLQGESRITPELLIEKGVLSTLRDGLKILGNGEIGRALEVTAHKVSETAKKKIEAAGGTITLLPK